MKLALKDFQERAVDDLANKVRFASQGALQVGSQAVVLSAPTGSGKTVVMTALIERILQGDDTSEPDPDATFLWITDLPELNEQTMEKMVATSTVLNVFNLEVIGSSFDQRRLADGRVYFLNTQKLGKDKLLTQRGDGRNHSIWETIANTIAEKGGRFYVIIDEAHRGMRTKRQETEALSILQRFLVGYEVMPPAPVVIGVSATPKRFLDLLEGLNRFPQVHEVDVAEVRASGLLKDRIVLHHLADDQAADMTLLQEAARSWLAFTERWATYAEAEGTEPVKPIMVVQVADKSASRPTATPLDQAMSAIEAVLPEPLPPEAYAHSFDDGIALDYGPRTIRYVRPSAISGDPELRVVFFKTALSTGWDCPRAEVMMSFRKAVDATYIAQLIGRMVRTPLARRVERDETLNSVALFLPHYDADGVSKVIARLQDPEHEYVPPVEIDTAANTQVLEPATGMDEVFETLAKLPTYLVPSRRRAKQTTRLMRLARALGRDGITTDTHDQAKGKLVALLAEELKARRGEDVFRQLTEARGVITIGAVEYDQATGELVDKGRRDVEASAKNIDDLFAEAGRRVGEGLHSALWDRLVDGIDDLQAIRRAKIEVAVLLARADVLKSVEKLAEDTTNDLVRTHIDAVDALGEERQAVYRDIQGLAREPVLMHMRPRDRIVLGKPETAAAYPKHTYVDADGEFHGVFNTWEQAVLDAELGRDDVIGWMRNVDRKDWALQIPYRETTGVWRPLYPDFLVFRKDGDRFVVDILDPHDPTRQDAVPKAKGLAEFAENHGLRFGRLEIIMAEGDDLLRLDLNDKKVRAAVKVVDGGQGLRHLYEGVG